MAAKALTSKSLKINNLGGFMEVKYKRADELDCGDVIVIGGIETVIEYLEVVSGYILINKNEALAPPEAKIRLVCRAPSDLEIVQKALNVRGHHKVIIYNDGSWSVELKGPWGDDFESLLTWAKQQIGVE